MRTACAQLCGPGGLAWVRSGTDDGHIGYDGHSKRVVRRDVFIAGMAALLGAAAPASADTWSETLAAGQLSATVVTTFTPPSDGIMVAQDLELTVAETGGDTAIFRTPAFRPWGPDGNLVEQDGALQMADVNGDGAPEVLLTVMTGGAHCCHVTYLVTRDHRSNRFRLRRINWGNHPVALRDLDANGAVEIVGVDDRFAYAFGPFAVAEFPARVWRVRNDGLIGVTHRHPVYARAAMRASWRALVRHRSLGDPIVGAAAAYLANAGNVGGHSQRGAWVRVARVFGPTGRRPLAGIRNKLRAWGYRVS